MSQETIYALCAISASLAVIANQLLPYLLQRGRAGLKAIGIDLSPQTVSSLQQLAQLAIASAEEQAQKWIKSLQAEGKTIVTIAAEKLTSEQKEEIAIKAMRSLAPPGLTFTDEQAKVVIAATLQQTRSIIPEAVQEEIRKSVPPGTTYKSIAPGSLAPTADQLKSLEAMRIDGGTK